RRRRHEPAAFGRAPAMALSFQLRQAPLRRAVLGSPGRGSDVRKPVDDDEPAARMAAPTLAQCLRNCRPGRRAGQPGAAGEPWLAWQLPRSAVRIPAGQYPHAAESGTGRPRLRDEPGLAQAQAAEAWHPLPGTTRPGTQTRRPVSLSDERLWQ